MTRYRLDVLRDLDLVKSKIASNRKLVQISTNVTSVKVSDAVLPSLMRSQAELENELLSAIERPERETYGFKLPDGTSLCSQNILSRTEPLTASEIDALEIPAFLKRR